MNQGEIYGVNQDTSDLFCDELTKPAASSKNMSVYKEKEIGWICLAKTKKN